MRLAALVLSLCFSASAIADEQKSLPASEPQAASSSSDSKPAYPTPTAGKPAPVFVDPTTKMNFLNLAGWQVPGSTALWPDQFLIDRMKRERKFHEEKGNVEAAAKAANRLREVKDLRTARMMFGNGVAQTEAAAPAKADEPAASAAPAKVEPVAAETPPVAAKPAEPDSRPEGIAVPDHSTRLRKIDEQMLELKKQLQALRSEQHELGSGLDQEAARLLQPEIDEVISQLKALLQERTKLRKETKASAPAKTEGKAKADDKSDRTDSRSDRGTSKTDRGDIRIELKFSQAGQFFYVGPRPLVLSKLIELRDSGRLNEKEKAKLEPIIEDVRDFKREARSEYRLDFQKPAAGIGFRGGARLRKEANEEEEEHDERIAIGRGAVPSSSLDEAFKRASGTPHRSRTPESEKIERSLDRVISLKLDDKPLSEAIRQIGTLADCNVFLDSAGLEEVGRSSNSPVSIAFDGVSLRNALNLILEPLNLGYRIDNEVLKITSQRRAALDDLKYQQARLKALLDAAASLKSLGRDELADQLRDEAAKVQLRIEKQGGFEKALEEVKKHAAGSVRVGGAGRIKDKGENVDVLLHKQHERLVSLNEARSGLESIGRDEMARQLGEEIVKVKKQIDELHRQAAQNRSDRNKGSDARRNAREEIEEFYSRKGRSKREDDDDNGPLLHAIMELRNEVRETRKDVAELRKMIEGMKASNTASPLLNPPAGPALVVDPAVGAGVRVTVPYHLNGTTSGNPFEGAVAPPTQPPADVLQRTPAGPMIQQLLTPPTMIPGPGAGAVLPFPASKLKPGTVIPPVPSAAPMIPGPGPGVAPATETNSSSAITPGAMPFTSIDPALPSMPGNVIYRPVTELRETETSSGKVTVPVTRMMAVQGPSYSAPPGSAVLPAPVPQRSTSRSARQVTDGSIERQLKTTRVTMTMENSSLYKILMRIGAQANVRIEIDNKSLGLSGDAWKFDDRSFSIDVKDVPASKALFELLDPYGLSYVVKDGSVTITTRDGAASKLMRNAR